MSRTKMIGWLSATAMAAVGLSTMTATTALAAGEKGKGVNKAYIVQMVDLPVTAYSGGVRGYAATKPAKGQKIDPNGPAVVSYKALLNSKHDAALARVGASRKLYSYGYVFNGFAAELTEAQAQRLRQTPGVLAVTKDTMRRMTTSSTPDFLHLRDPGGAWSQAKGENVVIGIVDSGIWPEHPSFSDRTPDGKRAYQQIPGWHGKCTPGDSFNGSHCNQKLIGAQYFNAGFGGNAAIKAQFPYEFNSPRDADGHGSHTASTAGGNENVPATGAAKVLGSISGMAPRARIAAYKVCWGNHGTGGCAGVDSVAAIDQAVADGVDVINFSISGTSTNFLDPVEVAFLFAADAGVFVATSAGNSGPGSSTVAHPSPWVTTVAAGTHNRDGVGSVTLGNGATYSGASVAVPIGPKALIDSTVAGLPGKAPAQVALCYGAADTTDGVPVLDPAKVAGKIVVCDRGVTGRINKSLAVQQAGGIGMILVNTSPNSINADLHFVPTVHLQDTARGAVKAYAALNGAVAAINASTLGYNAPAPFTAAFSSRGPLLGGNGDLLKPDLMAPGQDILAAVSPVGYYGRLFDVISGTSMSSPHVAGLAALLKELRPTWSPMAIKSALMTTAGDVLDGGTPAPNTNPVLIFRQGAGHVQPNSAINPGLVFDSGFNDWLGFLCGTRQLTASYCPELVIDPSDLNVPSIAIGDMAGVQTVKRKVTNVGGSTAKYTLSHTGMSGFNVSFSPATLTVTPGQTASFSVTFTRTSSTLNAYDGGQLTLVGGGTTVRVPMVVRPVALAAPPQVSGDGVQPVSYDVTFGYTGTFSATPRGLIAPAFTDGVVGQDPDQEFDPTVPAGTVATTVPVAPGTTYARFSLFEAGVSPGSDLDLYVYFNGVLVGVSGSGGSDEEVNLVDPPAGNYTVYVHGWGVAGGTSPFKLHTWLLGSAAAGNMTVSAPSTATVGAKGTIGISTSGLSPATKYLGSVVYGGVVGMPNPTIVRVDTP